MISIYIRAHLNRDTVWCWRIETFFFCVSFYFIGSFCSVAFFIFKEFTRISYLFLIQV